MTGAGRGLGRAILGLFAVEGAQVIACDLDRELGEAAVSQINKASEREPRPRFYWADVGDIESLHELGRGIARSGTWPSILVNNAAIMTFKHTAEVDPEEYQRTMDVNVRGYWYMARMLYPYMKEKGSGSIINVGSTQPYQTRPAYFPYNASKGAVLALTKAMAVDFGADGIRVNALLPGIVDTKPMRKWLETFKDPARKLQEVLESHPLGRMPTAREVARAALFLASDDSSGISGAELVVDCGRHAKRP